MQYFVSSCCFSFVSPTILLDTLSSGSSTFVATLQQNTNAYIYRKLLVKFNLQFLFFWGGGVGRTRNVKFSR
jgi:hypothetical protein